MQQRKVTAWCFVAFSLVIPKQKSAYLFIVYSSFTVFCVFKTGAFNSYNYRQAGFKMVRMPAMACHFNKFFSQFIQYFLTRLSAEFHWLFSITTQLDFQHNYRLPSDFRVLKCWHWKHTIVQTLRQYEKISIKNLQSHWMSTPWFNISLGRYVKSSIAPLVFRFQLR